MPVVICCSGIDIIFGFPFFFFLMKSSNGDLGEIDLAAGSAELHLRRSP